MLESGLKHIILILFVIFQISINAQDTIHYKKNKFEISYGINKVGSWTDFTYDGTVSCDDCIEIIITNEGIEHIPRFMFSRLLNRKHLIKGGIGIIVGKLNFDEYNRYENTVIKDLSKLYQLIDISFGNKLVFTLNEKKSMIFENLIHNEININGYFDDYALRISSSLGIEFLLRKEVVLLTSINFGKELTKNIGRNYSYGFRIGITRTMN